MDHAGVVRRLEAGRHLARNRDDSRNWQPRVVAQNGGQIGALDVGHRDVLHAVDLAEIVNADDVLVRDLPRQQKLLLEAAFDVVCGVAILRCLGADDLQRDGDVQFGIPRLIDRAHAANAELPEDCVSRSELLSDRERSKPGLRGRGLTNAARGHRQPGRVGGRIARRRNGWSGGSREDCFDVSAGNRRQDARHDRRGQEGPTDRARSPCIGHFSSAIRAFHRKSAAPGACPRSVPAVEIMWLGL